MKNTKLHEILAVEKTRTSAANKLMVETATKFQKSDMFSGHIKKLDMIEDNPQNAAISAAAYDSRELPTTVAETLEYALDTWAKAEDVIFTKNATNQVAVADLQFRGAIIATAVPVDELLGLEERITNLRKIMEFIPTLSAAVSWDKDTASGRLGAWRATHVEKTTKTEKVTVPVVLYEATDKHPAQVKESSTDKTVGTFTKINFSGAATSAQKAAVLVALDELLAEVKQARMRANSVDIVSRNIGKIITNIIMDEFKVY